MSRRTAVSKYIRLRMMRPVFAEQSLNGVQHRLAEIDVELTKSAKILRSPLSLQEKTEKDLGRVINTLQREKEGLRVEQSRLAAAIVADLPSREALREEFLHLKAIPSLYSIWVEGSCVVLCLRARLRLDGEVYHLGDWRLMLNLASDTLETSEIRSGLSELARSDGFYLNRQYSWNFGFCFGRNLDLVEGLVEQGDYVTAMRVAATYMNGVNPDHVKDVPLIYRKVS